MFGRLLGGIATSLLFSAFESWIVAEHFGKGLEEKWLGDTFSKVGGGAGERRGGAGRNGNGGRLEDTTVSGADYSNLFLKYDAAVI